MQEKQDAGSVAREIKQRTGKKYLTVSDAPGGESGTPDLRGRDGINRNDRGFHLNSFLFQSFREQIRQMKI